MRVGSANPAANFFTKLDAKARVAVRFCRLAVAWAQLQRSRKSRRSNEARRDIMTFSLLSLFKSNPPAATSEENEERDTKKFIVEKITASREKIALPSFVLEGGRSADGKVKPALLRFSRLRIQIRNLSEERCLTLVGKSVGVLVRLASIISAEVERVPAFLFPNSRVKTDWTKIWRAALAATLKQHREGQWVRIYLDGVCEFTEQNEQKFYDVMEGLACGAELLEENIQSAAAKAVNSLEAVPARYTGQTYLVVSRSGHLYRGAFTYRHDRHNQTLFAYAPMMIDERSIRMSRFVSFCADVVDALVLKPMVSGLKGLPDAERKAKLDQLLDAAEHQAGTLTRIVAFERGHRVQFRPERPTLD